MQGECALCGQPDQAVVHADGENEAGGRILRAGRKFTPFTKRMLDIKFHSFNPTCLVIVLM